jgi:hypothetical protein
MPDLPPPPARPRAEDYASVATIALARVIPADVRLIAQDIADRTPLEFGARMRFKLWVNSQPDLPFIW